MKLCIVSCDSECLAKVNHQNVLNCDHLKGNWFRTSWSNLKIPDELNIRPEDVVINRFLANRADVMFSLQNSGMIAIVLNGDWHLTIAFV